jgi:hypothetical protein
MKKQSENMTPQQPPIPQGKKRNDAEDLLQRCITLLFFHSLHRLMIQAASLSRPLFLIPSPFLF